MRYSWSVARRRTSALSKPRHSRLQVIDGFREKTFESRRICRCWSLCTLERVLLFRRKCSDRHSASYIAPFGLAWLVRFTCFRIERSQAGRRGSISIPSWPSMEAVTHCLHSGETERSLLIDVTTANVSRAQRATFPQQQALIMHRRPHKLDDKDVLCATRPFSTSIFFR